MTATKAPKTATRSLDAWEAAKYHEPILPSGFQPKIIIPDLSKLVSTGQIPQDLLEVAVGALDKNTPSIDLVKTETEYTEYVIRLMVVEPELPDSKAVDRIPAEDKAMLIDFANRQRDLDAVGNHLGGLNKSEDFRRFRKLGEFDEDVAGL